MANKTITLDGFVEFLEQNIITSKRGELTERENGKIAAWEDVVLFFKANRTTIEAGILQNARVADNAFPPVSECCKCGKLGMSSLQKRILCIDCLHSLEAGTQKPLRFRMNGNNYVCPTDEDNYGIGEPYCAIIIGVNGEEFAMHRTFKMRSKFEEYCHFVAKSLGRTAMFDEDEQERSNLTMVKKPTIIRRTIMELRTPEEKWLCPECGSHVEPNDEGMCKNCGIAWPTIQFKYNCPVCGTGTIHELVSMDQLQPALGCGDENCDWVMDIDLHHADREKVVEIHDSIYDLASLAASTDVFCNDCPHKDRGFLAFFKWHIFCKHPKVYTTRTNPVSGVQIRLRTCREQNRNLRCDYYEPKETTNDTNQR